jgi:hypothetical protein
MTEVTNAKAAVFNLFNIGSALLNAMTLCQLIKAIDDYCNANFLHIAYLKLIKKTSCSTNKY